MMAAIGYAIPSSGISVSDITIKFPSISDLSQHKTPEIEYRDDAIDKAQAFIDARKLREFMQTRKMSEQMQHRKNAINHRYAISYPNDSIEWIFPVLSKLENAKEGQIRIMHYGDSQIEVDRITSTIRNGLQSQFGGNGVGIVPAIQTIPIPAIIQSCDKELPRFVVYGPKSMQREDKSYGPVGQSVEITDNAEFSFQSRNIQGNRHRSFEQLTILLDKIEKPVNISVVTENNTIEKTVYNNEHEVKFDISGKPNRLKVRISGMCLVYGFMFDGKQPGVAYDNIAMRGCSGTIFTSIARQSLVNFYHNHDIPLIIMQFGGNSVPYLKTTAAIDSYCRTLEYHIDYLKHVSPDSKILFIGPSDMSTNINGQMQSYPMLKTIVEKMKTMCLENDVAYWDIYKAMGGNNSMVKWANSSPALAGSDHVHLTTAGAEKIGDMILDGFLSAYDYYKYLNDESETTK